MNAAVSNYTQHFRFYPCLSLEDFHNASNSPGYPCQYIHHFFPTAVKLNWPAEFRIQICYIPTTFEVHIRAKEPFPRGNDPYHDVASILRRLEVAQPFQGLFMDEKRFCGALRSLELSNESLQESSQQIALKKTRFSLPNDDKLRHECPYVAIPGTEVARLDYSFGDNRGEDFPYLVEMGTCMFGDNNSEFALVHRRIEWMAHFFIETLSPISIDSRWRLFFLVRFLESPSNYTTQVEVARNRAREQDGKAAEAEAAGKDGAKENHWVRNIESQDAYALSQSLLSDYGKPIEIVGFLSMFQYFSVPLDRARISQFFLLPSYQHRGLGSCAMKTLMDYLAESCKLQYVSVENPCTAFQLVRDRVSVIRAVEARLFSRECFAGKGQFFATFVSNAEWVCYRNVLRDALLESPSQVNRIRALVLLGDLMPLDCVHFLDLPACVAFFRNAPELAPLHEQLDALCRVNNDSWANNPNISPEQLQKTLDEAVVQIVKSLVRALRSVRMYYKLADAEKLASAAN